ESNTFEGVYDEGQPPTLSCHTPCTRAMLSHPFPRELCPTSQHPGCAYQRHRGQQEHPTAPHRHEGPRWHQAREPRQTLCAVVRQRPYPGGSILSALCGCLAASSRFV